MFQEHCALCSVTTTVISVEGKQMWGVDTTPSNLGATCLYPELAQSALGWCRRREWSSLGAVGGGGGELRCRAGDVLEDVTGLETMGASWSPQVDADGLRLTSLASARQLCHPVGVCWLEGECICGGGSVDPRNIQYPASLSVLSCLEREV